VKLLVDTRILIWAMGEPARLGPSLCFSVASLWELVIKAAFGREAFQVQPSLLRRTLLDGGFEEIPIEAAHVLAVAQLPRRCSAIPLIACCWPRRSGKGLLLFTADALLASYPDPVRHQGSF
jgi:PIN domain nuclease of toxin-antitoxin system